MTNATTATKITIVKTENGWVASNLPGMTFDTRQTAREASKFEIENLTEDVSDVPTEDDADSAADADPALAAAQAQIDALTAKIEALTAQAAPAPVDGAEEVIIVLPAGHALPDARRRRTVYEADADNLARFPSAAAQDGEKVLYPPYAWGGEAHMAIANALSQAGMVAGDSLEVDDLRCVPGGKPNQARWGSQASRATARHRMTNAGMLERVGAGKRGVSYILTDAFFTPEAWPSLAAAALADRANTPVATAG